MDFVLGLANATQLSSSLISIAGAEETIDEFLRVRFTIQSTDPAVSTHVPECQGPSTRTVLCHGVPWYTLVV